MEEIKEILERIEEKLDNGIAASIPNGVIRTTDNLGRLTIPKDYRTVMGIDSDSQLEICLINNMLIVKKKD